MERVFTDAKVLWSNMYRGVRNLYLTFVKPRESRFPYRLLTTLFKYRDALLDVTRLRGRMLLRIKYNGRIRDSEAAYATSVVSMNLISKLVNENPGMIVSSYFIKGVKKPKLLSAVITFDKNTDLMEAQHVSVIFILNPELPPSRIKREVARLAMDLWYTVRNRLHRLNYPNARYLAGLPPGDVVSVITFSTLQGASEEIRVVVSDGNEYREVRIPVRVPEWKLSDLPPKIIEDIEVAVIKPIKKSFNFASRGALITGPPGVGKTVMAEALADALNLKVVELRPTTYRSMWYGATEKMLNAIFKQVSRRRKDLALIIDDAEFISSRKYTIHEAHISEISTVLYHLQRPDRPFTVLTANNPDLIDPAILRPGRIDVTVVLGYPDRAMRRQAILRDVRTYRIAVEDRLLDEIVDITKWYSLAEVDAFIRLAAGKGDGRIGEKEIEWARRKFNISVSERRSTQEYLRWWASKTQGIVISYIPSETEI